MWTKGMVDGYDYCIKHSNGGSIYGIDGGQISPASQNASVVVMNDKRAAGERSRN